MLEAVKVLWEEMQCIIPMQETRTVQYHEKMRNKPNLFLSAEDCWDGDLFLSAEDDLLRNKNL